MAGDKEAREGEDLYVLRADFMRYVRTVGYAENGRPLNEPKRYVKGDSISLSKSEAERYLRSGAMVKQSDYDEEKQAEEDAKRRAEADLVLSSMAVHPTAAGQNHGQPVVGLEDAEPEKTAEPKAHEVDGIEVEDVMTLPPEQTGDPDVDLDDESEKDEPTGDQYTDMSYPDLQREAKDRTGNGGGNAEELRARLREHDAQQ